MHWRDYEQKGSSLGLHSQKRYEWDFRERITDHLPSSNLYSLRLKVERRILYWKASLFKLPFITIDLNAEATIYICIRPIHVTFRLCLFSREWCLKNQQPLVSVNWHLTPYIWALMSKTNISHSTWHTTVSNKTLEEDIKLRKLYYESQKTKPSTGLNCMNFSKEYLQRTGKPLWNGS